jgi:hypothetical protein
MLWAPTRWAVRCRPDLDFHYVAREISPGRVMVRGKPVQQLQSISMDVLLVNANDRTPIVAEVKLKSDESAELALVQALPAAAQLAP